MVMGSSSSTYTTPLAPTIALPCPALMGCGLFWLMVSCPVEELNWEGKTTSPVLGAAPVVPDRVKMNDEVSEKSMGWAGTGKKGSGVPAAVLTCAFTTSDK